MSSQTPHIQRLLLAAFVTGIPEHKIRCISPDVGGAFGSKIFCYADMALVMWASKAVGGRPVKWVEGRRESFGSTIHGRDHVTYVDVAATRDGEVKGLRVRTIANLGGRLSTIAPIYGLATLYVSMVRGTPLIVQIIFVYLALPQFGIVLPALAAGIFALGFNYGAYLTEIFRAGIQAVPRGQREAAAALGMTERQIMRRVVLPQAVRIVIPAIGNDFISMTKDSALVSFVGIQELFWRASTVGTRFFRSFETLLVAALAYWAITIVLSFFQERLEQRMAESDRRI
jgi:His/Glu/Gln/Arg/opine family amino acid ABC transporter permease subunit